MVAEGTLVLGGMLAMIVFMGLLFVVAVFRGEIRRGTSRLQLGDNTLPGEGSWIELEREDSDEDDRA